MSTRRDGSTSQPPSALRSFPTAEFTASPGVQARRRGRNSSDRIKQAALHPLQALRNQEGYAKGSNAQNLPLGVMPCSALYVKTLAFPMNTSENMDLSNVQKKQILQPMLILSLEINTNNTNKITIII